MYFPVQINDAATGLPLVELLRPGNSHSGKGIKAILRWLFWRLKSAFPTTKITLRGDCGFSLPEIITLCERAQVYYLVGFSSNAVLQRKIASLMEQARLEHCATGHKARLFNDVYYQAGSWDIARRIVMKAEYLPQGANARFVLTNREESPQFIYDTLYVQRAEDSENRIKEFKLHLSADRLSCTSFYANQFRLILHQAAYWLFITLRRKLHHTGLEKAQVTTLRHKLIKVAVRVRCSVRRVYIQICSSFPHKQQLLHLAYALQQ